VIEVVSAGIIVADILAQPIDRYPEKGRLVLFDRLELHVGGCAANVANALGKLGRSAAVMGRVGVDAFGEHCVAEIEASHVDASGIVRTPGAPTSATFVAIASDGERAFFHIIGANALFSLADIDMTVVRRAKVLLVAGTFVMPALDGQPTATLLKRAKEAGLTTVLDTVYNDRVPNPLTVLGPALPYLDYFVPNLTEAELVTGARGPRPAAEVLLGRGCRCVVIKLGQEGVYCLTGAGEEFRVPAYRVTVVDATGAGDAWVAGFLTGLLEGWPLREALLFGNAVGGQAVQTVGGTTGIPTFAAVRRFQQEAELRPST
jgi:sugar/nucleoside kinase (ribokinase family)